jgi:inner membrane protein
MSRVIDLSAQRRGGGTLEPLQHPAGVTLPFEGPSDAALIIPEIRGEIRSGAYDADIIALIGEAVEPGDRVLVIGAGLGVVSTLIARRPGVERVIAVEANTALIPYLERTHALNGVARVETVNAVLAEGKKGRVPFFARRDIRASSLLPHDRSWQQVMMVPFMDLNLILAEERITLVVSEIPAASAELLARAELGHVERILLSIADDPSGAWEDDGVCALLVARGFVPEAAGTAVLFRRADVLAGRRPRAAETAGAAAAPAETGAVEAAGEAEREPEIAEAQGEAATAAARPAAAEPPAGPLPGELAAPRRRRRRRRRGGGAAEAGAPPEAPREPAGAAPGGNGRGRRVWGLVALALFLALPLMLIGQLASERAGARSAALAEIGAAWGGPQTLTGPLLVVPVLAADGTTATPLVLLPQALEVATEIETERRQEGAFEALVFRSESEFRLQSGLDGDVGPGLLAPGETALWADTLLALGVSDPAALDRAELMGGQPHVQAFAPGSGIPGLAGIHARIGDPRDGPPAWRFLLALRGSEALRLTPAGAQTVWRLHADWPRPAFVGGFLPSLREIGPRGFVAEWVVPQVAHALPGAFRGAGPLTGLDRAAFGVELVQPADLYGTAQRAAKFGLLFIALTFGAIFLIERSARRTARVVHYALVGAAQCAFFLLLLALAERIGFTAAYGLAALVTVGLLTAYAWAGIGLGSRAGWVTLALAVLYAVMYPVLMAAEHALLMGAVLTFLVVGALMWGTREGALRAGSAAR